MKLKPHAGSHLFRRTMVLVVLVCLLAVVVQVGLAQTDSGPAAVADGTLTVSKSTTPAGGQDFWVTASSFQNSWGSRGSGPGQYRQPRDVDTDAAGNFYISDHRNSYIHVLDADGDFLMNIGSRGRGNGQLLRPNQIAISGSLLVVPDTDNHRVAVFNTNGDFVENWGSIGSGNGQFRYPQGVAFDAAGNIYVADTFNHRIQVFSQTGDYLRQWGTLGSSQGQFRYPTHLDFGLGGGLYVVDSNNHRIQVFDSQGAYIRQFGSLGSGPGQFRYPVGIDIGTAGFVYVGDMGNNRVQKLTTNGAFVGQWSQVAGGAAISRPNGLLSAGNMVYATDIDANKVQIFSQASFLLDGGQQLSTSLPAGTYNVVEAPKTGWTVNSATCNAGSPTNITGGVRVTLGDGATVVCSFANGQ